VVTIDLNQRAASKDSLLEQWHLMGATMQYPKARALAKRIAGIVGSAMKMLLDGFSQSLGLEDSCDKDRRNSRSDETLANPRGPRAKQSGSSIRLHD
jgi:hypothetical protein